MPCDRRAYRCGGLVVLSVTLPELDRRWPLARYLSGMRRRPSRRPDRDHSEGTSEMSTTEASASGESVIDQVAEGIRSVAGAQRSAIVLGEDDNEAIHFVAAAGAGAEQLVGARGPAA